MKVTRSFIVAMGILVTTASAQAPVKFSGKQECLPPNPNYEVPVGDAAGHTLSLSVGKCLWTSGTLGGSSLKDEQDATVDDVIGGTVNERGYGVGTVASGDKYFTRYQGVNTLKSNVLTGSSGTWTFTGGTGKLAGIKGKGTYKGSFTTDGKSTFDIEGEYQLTAFD